MGKKSVSSLKKKADQVFSQYIRLRDADSNGYLDCITCGREYHWKQAQAGHFVSRKVSLLRFDEQNVNGQCVGCNMFKGGEQYAYSRALDMKYGVGTAEKLWNRRFETHKFTIGELEALIEEYKERVKEEEHGTDH